MIRDFYGVPLPRYAELAADTSKWRDMASMNVSARLENRSSRYSMRRGLGKDLWTR